MLIASHILWNLFLAFIPVVLAFGIAILYWRMPQLLKRWWIWIPLGLLWLGFLPNTCYLLTEWRHFIEYIVKSPQVVAAAQHDKSALLDFLAQASFYVVYSGTGLFAFSLSIWPIAQIVRPSVTTKIVFFLLCALGVYLGLIRRLNTWDLWHHPRKVLAATTNALHHPLLILLIIGFGGLLWLNYWLFEVFVDGLLYRSRILKQAKAAV